MQQNNKSTLSGDRDDTVIHMIREYCKLAQKST